MNLSDIRPEGQDVLDFLRDEFGPRGYTFEMRAGAIWERSQAGEWYLQRTDLAWWRRQTLYQNWAKQQ